MARAVFLDRDGVVNDVILEPDGSHRSPRKFSEFKLKAGVKSVVQELSSRGYLPVLVTNQPEVKRGLLDKVELDKMMDFVVGELSLADVRTCLHDQEDACSCRKPEPGMLLQAAASLGVDLSQSFMVGDTIRDVEAGRRAGCTTVMLNAPYNEDIPSDIRIRSLEELLNYCV